MKKLKVFSLFSGIGSPEKALTNLNVQYELLGFSEFYAASAKAYSAIHSVSEELNYGDITKLDLDTLPSGIDLITHGSPCQDYSKAGKNGGGDLGSGTRSSLMWNTVEIVSRVRPKYVIWENVPNVLSKRHRHNFDKYIDNMSELGYASHSKILNSRNYGIPQNRERVFVVSILKDQENAYTYEFPSEKELSIRLKDLLEPEVDNKFFISKEEQDLLTYGSENGQILIKNATKLGYLKAQDGDGIDLGYPNSETRRGRVQQQRAHTLTTGSSLGVLIGDKIRKYTPLETFRLMGFADDDYYKVVEAGIREKDLYHVSGNSIVVNVMEAIFKELLKGTEYIR